MGLLPPSTPEEIAAAFPTQWERDLRESSYMPLEVGQRVCDVLNGRHWGDPFGTVVEILKWPDLPGVLVEMDGGGWSASAAMYWRAIKAKGQGR